MSVLVLEVRGDSLAPAAVALLREHLLEGRGGDPATLTQPDRDRLVRLGPDLASEAAQAWLATEDTTFTGLVVTRAGSVSCLYVRPNHRDGGVRDLLAAAAGGPDAPIAGT